MTLYIENTRSVVLTQPAYGGKYRGQKPCDNTIRCLLSNFVEHGTVRDRQRTIHQRPRRSNKVIEAVRESVAQNLKMPYRRIYIYIYIYIYRVLQKNVYTL
nr:unnamed protein product [Callosobruchus analis]